MNPRAIPAPIRAKLARPASITLRFTDDEQYWLAVSLYSQTLKKEIPTRPEKLPPFYSFGLNGKGFLGIPRKSIELRLEKDEKHALVKGNSTIVYWQIEGENLAQVHEELCKLPGYHERECPPPPSLHKDGSTQRSVIEDGDGNQIGLMMNPPFPHGRQAEAFFISPAKYIALLATFALSAALLGVFQRSRKPHR